MFSTLSAHARRLTNWVGLNHLLINNQLSVRPYSTWVDFCCFLWFEFVNFSKNLKNSCIPAMSSLARASISLLGPSHSLTKCRQSCRPDGTSKDSLPSLRVVSTEILARKPRVLCYLVFLPGQWFWFFREGYGWLSFLYVGWFFPDQLSIFIPNFWRLGMTWRVFKCIGGEALILFKKSCSLNIKKRGLFISGKKIFSKKNCRFSFVYM